MKTKLFLMLGVLGFSLSASAELVTFEGTIAKVVAKKHEIYVDSKEGKIELYFGDKTELVKGGQPAQFTVLEAGKKVRVTADKKGKRYTPTKVEALE